MDAMTVAIYSSAFGALALACALAMRVWRSLGRARSDRRDGPGVPETSGESSAGRLGRHDAEGSDMAHVDARDRPDRGTSRTRSPVLAAMSALIRREHGESTAPEPAAPAVEGAPPVLGDAPDMVARRATQPKGLGPRKPGHAAPEARPDIRQDAAGSVGPLSGFDPAAEVLVLVWDDAVAEAPPRLSVQAAEDAPGWNEVRADGVLVGRVPHAGLTEADLRLMPRSRLPD